MSKPNYRVILSYDADRKVFSARAPELEHCTGEGATRAEAIAKVEEEIDAQLANMLSHGSTPPKSVDEEEYNGELSIKVSKLLHRDLSYQARTDGIDVNQLAGEILAAGMESRRQGRPQQGSRRPEGGQNENFNRHDGQRRGGFGGGGAGRGNYHQVMDDRANFIEYVRGLEHGQTQGGGGFGHARNGGPNMNGGGGAGGAGRRGGRRGGGRGPGGPGGGGRHDGGGRPQHFGQRNGGAPNGGAPQNQAAPQPTQSPAPESAPVSSAPAGHSGGEGGEGFGNV